MGWGENVAPVRSHGVGFSKFLYDCSPGPTLGPCILIEHLCLDVVGGRGVYYKQYN